MKIPTWVWIASAAGLGWWLWKKRSATVTAPPPLPAPVLQPIGVDIPTPIHFDLPGGSAGGGALQFPGQPDFPWAIGDLNTGRWPTIRR